MRDKFKKVQMLDGSKMSKIHLNIIRDGARDSINDGSLGLDAGQILSEISSINESVKDNEEENAKGGGSE